MRNTFSLFTPKETTTWSFMTAAASHIGSFFIGAVQAIGHAALAIANLGSCVVSALNSAAGYEFDASPALKVATEIKDTIVEAAKAVFHIGAAIVDIAISAADCGTAAFEMGVAATIEGSKEVASTLSGEESEYSIEL